MQLFHGSNCTLNYYAYLPVSVDWLYSLTKKFERARPTSYKNFKSKVGRARLLSWNIPLWRPFLVATTSCAEAKNGYLLHASIFLKEAPSCKIDRNCFSLKKMLIFWEPWSKWKKQRYFGWCLDPLTWPCPHEPHLEQPKHVEAQALPSDPLGVPWSYHQITRPKNQAK